jgi:hypothetical protein
LNDLELSMCFPECLTKATHKTTKKKCVAFYWNKRSARRYRSFFKCVVVRG